MGEGGGQGRPAAVHDDPATGVVQHRQERGVEVDRDTPRQAAAADHPLRACLGRAARSCDQQPDLVGAQFRTRLVELGDGAVGLDDADVRPHGTIDRDRHDLDALRLQQSGQLGTLRAPAGQNGAGLDAVGRQGPGNVDALAARVDARTAGAQHRTSHKLVHLDGAVDAGVGGEGDDHASTSLKPAADKAAASASSRPLSVMRVSISSKVAKRASRTAPTLLLSARTTLRRAEAIMACLTAASAGSGVVSPRSTVIPFVPMKATSTKALRKASRAQASTQLERSCPDAPAYEHNGQIRADGEGHGDGQSIRHHCQLVLGGHRLGQAAGGGAGVEQDRPFLGKFVQGGLADAFLLGNADGVPGGELGFEGETLHGEGPAVHPAQHPVPFEHRQVTSDGLARDVELLSQRGDVDPAPGPRPGQDLPLPLLGVHVVLPPLSVGA